jgi:integrase
MVRKRNQHGSMRVLSRQSGDVFEYRYYRTRSDGKRAPANFVVGSVAELKTEAGAWAKVRRMNFNPNSPVNTTTTPITFGEIAKDYIRVELANDQCNVAIPKAHSTVETYRRYINRHILPRWETVRASEMEPIAIQNWLRELRVDSNLSNSTLVKIRNVMVAIFKHAQRYGLLPRTQEANPMTFVRQTSVSNYEPVVLTLAQCVDILANLTGMHRVLVLADAATGLRISEMLALRWSDIDGGNSCIRVTRAYVYGKFGPPKSKASKKPVPSIAGRIIESMAQRNTISGK